LEEGKIHFIRYTFLTPHRICTGQYLADDALWIAITTILASCTIAPAVDKDGRVIIPANEMRAGAARYVAGISQFLCLPDSEISSHPKEFKCVITPRSANAKELLMEGLRNAD
jgi:hypothetical protein